MLIFMKDHWSITEYSYKDIFLKTDLSKLIYAQIGLCYTFGKKEKKE